MTEFTYSVSIIIPEHLVTKARRLAWALAHDEPPLSSFSAQLTNNLNTNELTHLGLHTYAQQGFVNILQAAQQGTLPPAPWGDYNLTEQQVRDAVSSLTVVIAKGNVSDTWPQAMSQANVQMVEVL